MRALTIGALLVLGVAVLAPWRDATYSILTMQIPPVLTLVLVAFAAVVNPLLGRHRLWRGEVVVIAIMLLAASGVAGLGLARSWAPLQLGMPKALAEEPRLEELREPQAPESAAARREALAAARFARWDADGDGFLAALPGRPWSGRDVDDDGRVSRAEWLAGVPEHLEADAWRWPVSHALVPLVPASGPVSVGDAEYRFVVMGYFDGLPPHTDRLRVGHRSEVTWIDAEGREQVGVPAYEGRRAEDALLAGEPHLDLGDPVAGGDLRGLRAGDRTDGAEVIAVEPAGLPWAFWAGQALAWSPLIFGGLVAMIALARVVHHQWLHNERLPYPLASVLSDLTEDPAPGRRRNRVVTSRAFQIGFLAAVGLVLWKGLFTFGFLPFDIQTQWNLWPVFGGGAHQHMPNVHWIITPALYPSVVAIAFLLTKEIGFSLWAVFLGTQLLTMFANIGGVPITGEHLADASMGGGVVFLAVILWWGRRYYLAVLRAALGRGGDPAARAAAPYAWLLLGGASLALATLIAHGATPVTALAGVVGGLAVLLLFARLVAEAGVPFPTFPHGYGFNLLLMRFFGTGFGPGAWIPVLLFGSLLADRPRESLLGYQVTAHYLADRGGLRQRRVVQIAIVTVVVVGVVATAAALVYHYLGGGAWRGGGSGTAKGQVLLPLTAGGPASETPWAAWGVGAGATGAMALARVWLSWWPLHPIGLVMCMSNQLQRCWFSYFTGWLLKSLVQRYGGTRCYQALKPAVIGVIAGEAIVLIGFLAVKMAWHAAGKEVPFFLTLP